MKKSLYYKTLLLGLSASASMISYARVESVRSIQDFDRLVNAAEFGVALFYNGKPVRAFEKVSNDLRYRDSGVVFVKVNIRKGHFEHLMEEYAIDELPTVILFDKGKVVVNDQGAPISLIGVPSDEETIHFIEENLGGYINDMLGRDKVHESKEYVAEKRVRPDRSHPRPYPYDPYYYYPRRPLSPLGVGPGPRYGYGWRRRCHSRYGCGYRYW